MPQHAEQLALVAEALDRLAARIEAIVQHLDGDLVPHATRAGHRRLVDLAEAPRAEAGVHMELSNIVAMCLLWMVFHLCQVPGSARTL